MSPEFFVIGFLVIAGFILLVFFLNKKLSELQKNKPDQTLLEWLKSMESTLHLSSNNMVKTLQENSKQLNDRLDRAAVVIQNVGHEVGQMSEIGRSMRELQDFLKNPKLRGNIGEAVLKDLISQIFPKNSFHLQYQFKSGDIVDAAIKTDSGILPIDSKFPMENFQKMAREESEKQKEQMRKIFAQDVKKHIDAISRKYILPDEGTMDFALMYVPSESVYYEVINIADLMEYARDKRIYIVSPSTLYAHLQTILLSYEGKRIESKSKELFKMLRVLQLDYNKVEENINILGKHINNASSQFSKTNMFFSNLGRKIASAKTLEIEEGGEKNE